MEKTLKTIGDIRAMIPADYGAVGEIFQEGIESGNATFEKEVPSWQDWDKDHLASCRFVYTEGDNVLGWAALTPVSGRCVYAGVAEVSIYIAKAAHGKGVGSRLMEKLIAASEDAGFWTLQSGIFPENKISVHLHEKFGFRIVGVRKNIGEMHGQWRDVVLMERRSDRIGVIG